LLGILWACLVSLFGGVLATKRKKRGKACQTPRFFSAAVKRHFLGPLCFELKSENHKTQQESGFSPTAASKKRASAIHENKQCLYHFELQKVSLSYTITLYMFCRKSKEHQKRDAGKSQENAMLVE
jgi:hypothetical protein